MLSSYLILIHAPTKDATISPLFMTGLRAILIHASARDATAKSYKIGNNFTVLFRKFVQIFDILILHISIFLEKQEQYFYFCSANLPGFLRCFRFAPTFSYIVCQNLKSLYFSVENFLVVHTLYQFRQSTTSIGATAPHGRGGFIPD